MEKSIAGAKALIEWQVKLQNTVSFGHGFTEYSKTYYWTNENISKYLELVSFEGKESALAVCASGDHTFNLITNGITRIDTFDTNKLTEYFAFGFKRAMILKYDYFEFLLISHFLRCGFINIDKLSDILTSLLPYMDSKHRTFWKEIIDFNYKIQKQLGTNINLFHMLTFGKNFLAEGKNNYLRNKRNYETLKERLGRANITFKCEDAFNLSSAFLGNQYDFILLSNILYYFSKHWGSNWDYNKLKEYEKELSKLVKPEGVIFLQYLMDYNQYAKESKTFESKGGLDDLTDEEIYSIPSIHGENKEEGIILKRVKKPNNIVLK